MSTVRSTASRTAAGVVLCAGLAAPASALTINRTFNATNQYIDPFGVNRTAELAGVFNAAADMWESVITTPHTLSLTYQWGSIFGSGTISDHTLTSQSGGRETAGTITFHGFQSVGVSRNWYLDPTPFSDSEFNVQQTSWRQLSAAQKSDQFVGTAQNTFEVGSGGAAFSNAPDAARFGYDMLTYALHEIGHALGLDSANTAAVGQAFSDGDYDLGSQFMGGVSGVAARVPGSFPAFDIEHLRAEYSLMDATIGTGQRRGISAVDALATASSSLWTSLNLERKEFVGASGGAWTSGSSWIGGAIPNAGNTAFIRDLRSASISGPGNAGFLVVTEGALLTLNAGAFLTVSDALSISGGGSIRVMNSATLFVQSGAGSSIIGSSSIDLQGGSFRPVGGASFASGTEVFGFGNLLADGLIVNDGQIRAIGGGTLFVAAIDAGSVDLDGANNMGRVWASGGDLHFDAPMTDAFNGLMRVEAGRTLTMVRPWTQGAADAPPFQMNAGVLDLNGGGDVSPATLAGGTATLRGEVDVSGVAHINAPVIFGSTADVQVASGGRLELNNATSFVGGGTYAGAGEIQVDGALTINGGTTIDVADFDWDGGANNSTTVVNNGATFTINSASMGGSASSRYFQGSATLQNGSTLAVNSGAWNMAGLLTMNGGANVIGEMMTVRGDIDSNGANSIGAARVVFEDGASVALSNAGDSLALNGPITYRAGHITGGGTLVQNGNAFVQGIGTYISTHRFDWDGAGSATTMVADNAAFIIDVDLLGGGSGNSFSGGVSLLSGSQLSVLTASPWTLSGVVNNNGGSLYGSQLINDGQINGFGTIGAGLVNNGEIAAGGGELRLGASAGQLDLDGTDDETGVLRATNGDLRITTPLTGFVYNGTMHIGAGRYVSFDDAYLINDSGGLIAMTGGELYLNRLDQNDSMQVTGNTASVFASMLNFGGSSDTTIDSTLVVNAETVISPTATMTGAGTLRNDGALSGNFDIAVNLENSGVFNPGTSVGLVEIDGDFTQIGEALVNIEIAGAAQNQADRIIITGDAALGGSLDIYMDAGFTPDWGDRWSILSAGSVAGDFTNVGLTPLNDNMLLWWHEATEDSFDIGVRHVADLNHDDAVNFEDLNLVISFFNTAGVGQAGDANEDGVVDFADLNLVVSFFNTFAPTNVPAPGGAALAALALLTTLGRRRA